LKLRINRGVLESSDAIPLYAERRERAHAGEKA
jgi:hypothetical protein